MVAKGLELIPQGKAVASGTAEDEGIWSWPQAVWSPSPNRDPRKTVQPHCGSLTFEEGKLMLAHGSLSLPWGLEDSSWVPQAIWAATESSCPRGWAEARWANSQATVGLGPSRWLLG